MTIHYPALQLGRLYGLRFAVAPYLYLWISFVVTQKLFPMNWPKIYGDLKVCHSLSPSL